MKMLSLSRREAEIAGHLALGETEKEVAAGLSISLDTVHTHKKSIYRKLGARCTADVVRILAEYVTRMNLADLIRKEIIEPNIWRVCTMLLFLSLHLGATLNSMEMRRNMRIKVNTVRVVKPRKND